MSQITTGLRSALSHPMVYDFVQGLMGAAKFRDLFASDYIRGSDGDRVLDLGCGTAEILSHLPDVEYIGYDISVAYIEAARRRFGNRAVFNSSILNAQQAEELPSFDIVLALGVLHHLDDEVAANLVETAHVALKPGGRFVTFDPVFAPGQSLMAKFLISKDRGQNVRTQEEYENLAKCRFDNVKTSIRHQRWIPYTHCFIEATK